MAYDLSAITKGKTGGPWRIVVYGPDGTGKSTLAASVPGSVFIQTEDGLGRIDCQKFPLCTTYEDVIGQMTALIKGDHDYSTIVIDSIDWLESLMHKSLCAKGDEKGPKDSIVAFGYGKGYDRAAEEFARFLRGLDKLHSQGMNVFLIGHSMVKTFNDPEGESYDRYQIAIHNKAQAKVREWADVIGFVASEVAVRSEEGRAKNRAVAVGGNVLRIKKAPAYDAKCRYPNMPDELPLEWPAIADAIEASNNQ